MKDDNIAELALLVRYFLSTNQTIIPILKDNVIKTDCVYLYLEEDMGKSIPCCSKKARRGICNCDKNNHFLDNCDGCDSYTVREVRENDQSNDHANERDDDREGL